MAVNEVTNRSLDIRATKRLWDGTTKTYVYPPITWVDTRVGVNVRDYETRIAQLQSASSDYTLKKVFVKPGWIRFGTSFPKTGPKDIVYENLYDTVQLNKLPGIPVNLSAAVDIAKANFLSNAVSQQRPVMTGVVLGELKETLQMIRSPAESLRNLLEAYLIGGMKARRKYRRNLTHANRVIRDSWLEYQLGWKPLMADIKAACDAYALMQARPETFRAFGKSTASQLGAAGVTTDYPFESNYFYMIVNRKHIYETEASVKGVFKVPVSSDVDSWWGTLAQLSGVGTPWDFVPTVWELVPYSFVVDYFTTVGNVLNGLYAISLKWVWSSQAVKSKSVSTATAVPDVARLSQCSWWDVPLRWTFSSQPSSWERIVYVRSTPSMSVPLPRMNWKMNEYKWATLAALLSESLDTASWRNVRPKKG